MAPTLSCAAVIGLEELPLRDEPSPLGAASDTTTDAGTDAEPLAGCSGDFCERFDAPDWTPSAWSSPGGASNPHRAGTADLGIDPSGLTPPNALRTSATTDEAPAHALLVHRLPRPPGRGDVASGFRLVVSFKLDALTIASSRGPVPGAGSAVFGGVGAMRSAGELAGAALLATSDGIYLFAGGDVLRAAPPRIPEDGGVTESGLVRLYEGSTADLADRWARAELMVTTKAIATREGYTACAPVPEGLVVAAALGSSRLRQGCMTLPAPLGDAQWLGAPAVMVGAALFGTGAVTVRHDDVAFDFLDP